jgi:hypothetical protein
MCDCNVRNILKILTRFCPWLAGKLGGKTKEEMKKMFLT